MTFKCKRCGKKSYVKPSHKKLGEGIYCSRICSDLGRRKGRIIRCAQCNKKFYAGPKQLRRSKSKKNFCRNTCYLRYKATHLVWKNHPMWKNGKNAYLLLMRREKRQICKRCGIKNILVLLVHHIDKNRKNNVLSNLVWMCRNCHHLVHKYDETW